MGVVLCVGILGTFIFELKSRVGILKKTKNRKKSYKKFLKAKKKERKEEKLKKMMQKDVHLFRLGAAGAFGTPHRQRMTKNE